MARITRKSYKRKKVVLGICLFASVALISTGFAAWVLSANATAENKENISVGAVTDGQVEFGKVEWSEDSFRFDTKQSDNYGRMRYDSAYPDQQEVLTVSVSGYVLNPDFLDHVEITMTVSEEVKQAANNKNYIVLPECVDNNITLTDVETYTITATDYSNGTYPNLIEGDKIYKFKYDVSFEWGSAFNGMNPGEYYDDASTGGAKDSNGEYVISNDQVEATMADMKSVLETNAEYKITLTAVAK